MRAARKVIFPATPRPDWELWAYRLLALLAVLVWLSRDGYPHPALWWWHRSTIVAGALMPMLFLLGWIHIQRPQWMKVLLPAAVALFLCAALLFPVFARARECHGPSCMSNLKQLALASLQYCQDYDDRLPPMESRWTDALMPYLKNEQTFRCPGDEDHPVPRWDPADPPPVTYGLNPYLLGRKRTDVPRPAETILAWCGDAAGPVCRHNGGCHYAYADGHVKWIARDADPGMWNPWEPSP